MFDNGMRSSHWYALEITLEETLEFAGVGVFMVALIDQLRTTDSRVTIDFANDASSEALERSGTE